jgi:hypothetical protein
VRKQNIRESSRSMATITTRKQGISCAALHGFGMWHVAYTTYAVYVTELPEGATTRS